MSDFNVERLHYEIGAEGGNAYENPERLTFTNSLGRFDAQDGKLVVEPADHYSDEDSARAVVEPFLRDWEITTDLDLDIGAIRFKFLQADLVDRDPPPGNAAVLRTRVGDLVLTGHAATLTITRRRYPAPPASFQGNADVRVAYHRWKDHRAGHEPLQGMAYHILTILVRAAGTQRKAATLFAVDLDVLRKFSELTSTKGSEKTARKAPQTGSYQELTGQERAWTEQAIRLLIKRLGERGAGAPLSQITMADLPKL